jgi:hypothetical protein
MFELKILTVKKHQNLLSFLLLYFLIKSVFLFTSLPSINTELTNESPARERHPLQETTYANVGTAVNREEKNPAVLDVTI